MKTFKDFMNESAKDVKPKTLSNEDMKKFINSAIENIEEIADKIPGFERNSHTHILVGELTDYLNNLGE